MPARTLKSSRDLPTDPPARDVLEISIFGPGKGESIAAHVGDGRWVIVDSCIDQADKTIPVLGYLDRIGVDAATQVDAVVVTHAHDDHFAGMAQVYETCAAATLVVAPAATSEEFFALLHSDAALRFELRQSAYSEYRRLFELAQERGAETSTVGNFPIRYASPGRVLREWDVQGTPVTLKSLSPSDAATHHAQSILAENAVRLGTPRRLATIDPNGVSIALQIHTLSVSALLGADLTIGRDGYGWSGVLADYPDSGIPSSLFKVPHHGSVNAHHEGVWSTMLTDSLVALMAPYRGGRKPLPSPEDRRRILSLTDSAYCAASPARVAKSKAVGRTARDLGTVARNVRDPWGKSGQVRARTPMDSVRWEAELYWPAVDLRNVN